MRFAVKFAYDGKGFHGYARQPGLKTVEGEIIKILMETGLISDLVDSNFRSASRTDKDVSALGNVIAFDTNFEKRDVLEKLFEIHGQIIPYGLKVVDSFFNPRYAKLRCYRYYLKSDDLDFEKILSAASLFTDKHNFRNFAKMENFRDPVRTIKNIVVNRDDTFLMIDFYAQTFLWHQVRKIVSSLIKVGLGVIDEGVVKLALDRPEEDFDFGLAPAAPLVLKNIFYDFDFEYDEANLGAVEMLNDKIMDGALDVFYFKPPK